MKHPPVIIIGLALAAAHACGQTGIHNDIYTVTSNADRTVSIKIAGAPGQTLTPEFTVMFSATNPGIDENHSNYLLAPRTSILWRAYEESEESLNAFLNSSAVRADLLYPVTVNGSGDKRVWTWHADASKRAVKLKVAGRHARGTLNPFLAGQRHDLKASGARVSAGKIEWVFDDNPARPFTLVAGLELPPGNADPRITLRFKARKAGYFAAAFTGAPTLPVARARRVEQETATAGFRLFNHVVGEGTLHMPHVYLSSKDGWTSALALDRANMPFADPATGKPRVPYRASAYCGAMLRKDYANNTFQPMIFAPLMGGADSKMKPGDARATTVHYVLRIGDWKDVYREIARRLYGNTDPRDNTGTGSLNRTLERIVDFLANRNGQNYAMWHDEQKYYDYANDLPGSFKPFSPLFGLSLALAFDDEDFYRARVRPQVEFALSRNTNYFAPYDIEKDTAMISVVNRRLGTPYLGYAQLVSLHGMYQNRNHALLHYVGEKGAARAVFPELLAKYSVTKAPADLDAALRDAKADLAAEPSGTRDHFMDWLDIWEASGETPATRDPAFLNAAAERAYGKVISTFTLAPAVPDADATFDAGGFAPVHAHSVGRHIRWGFPKPLGYPTPEQTVPAWRGALNGLQGLGPYRAEFWMDNHAHLMRIGALTGDDFLRAVARWGMVGRFAHYPGDNRSAVSLLVERPGLAENPLWKMTHATFNPGHAWEFGAAVLDFLVADVFACSQSAIDFPSRSMHGAQFRVRLYGDRPGRFYDETGIRLWMPKRLAVASSPQIDYISGYGNGKLYFAFVNQAAAAQEVTVLINPAHADVLSPHAATLWVNNERRPDAVTVSDNRLRFAIPAKGIVACAISDVAIRRGLHEKMLAPGAPVLGAASLRRDPLNTGATPPATVTGMLLSLGEGLTHAYIYADAQAADTQSARLRYRQGADSAWREKADAIFPYEFSEDFIEGAGDFEYSCTLINKYGDEYSTPPLKLAVAAVAQTAKSARSQENAASSGRFGNLRYDDAIAATAAARTASEAAPPPAPQAKPGPRNLTATAQPDGSVRLSWDALDGATGYTVKRTDVAAGPYFGPFDAIAWDIRGTTYTDTGGYHLGVTQHYVVSAMLATGRSADSEEAAAIPRKGTGSPRNARPAPAAAHHWRRTQDFTDYMKEVTNPAKTCDFGKSARDGGVYFPYSSPYGRRIGYGLPPQGNKDFTDGISAAEADERLGAALDAVAAALRAYIPAHYPEKSFEHLPADLQEVLVDYGFTEGVENIPATLVAAVYAPDPWDRIAHDMVYVRIHEGILQPIKNKAFRARWLAPKGY